RRMVFTWIGDGSWAPPRPARGSPRAVAGAARRGSRRQGGIGGRSPAWSTSVVCRCAADAGRALIRNRVRRGETDVRHSEREGHLKRFGFLLVVLALAGAALTSAVAGTQAKKTICARTTSATKPYKKVTVSGAALKAALKNPADIVPAPSGGCP